MVAWRTRIMVSLVTGVGLLITTAFTQDPVPTPEGIPPESDYMYRQHYPQVQEILKTSLDERAQRLEAYMNKLHPEAKIRQFMESFFGQIVKDLQAAGKTAAADDLLAKMAKLFPKSSASLSRALDEAIQAKNHSKIIQLGEEIYSKSPNPQLAVVLAESYIATNNSKAVEFSRRAVETLGAKNGVYFAVYLANHLRAQRDINGAIEYYNQILKAYPSGAPQGWDHKAWNDIKTVAHSLRGREAYVAKNYDAALREYDQVVKYAPDHDGAYLFIGLSHWRKQELDEAMAAFAKAVVLNKTNAAKAREYLEQIYKPRNGDSLEGLDELLNQARAVLGIG